MTEMQGKYVGYTLDFHGFVITKRGEVAVSFPDGKIIALAGPRLMYKRVGRNTVQRFRSSDPRALVFSTENGKGWDLRVTIYRDGSHEYEGITGVSVYIKVPVRRIVVPPTAFLVTALSIDELLDGLNLGSS